ncbi:MAG TPA: hypothetical protein VEW28_06830 [Candidatus Kapabacteria bacterium]|nr:hypothetical protein [Candidatus Kapabacteria bacterium]
METIPHISPNYEPLTYTEDFRLYRSPKYLYATPDYFMQLPKEISKCVVFIGAKKQDGGYDYKGTAFWISRNSAIPEKIWTYLVTAKHIVDKIRGLSTGMGMRVNRHDGTSEWIEIPINNWHFHPTDSTCDIAIMTDISPDFKIYDWYRTTVDSIVDENYINKYELQAGDDVFSPGLFARHVGIEKSIPIIRVGTIAAMETDDLQIYGDGRRMKGYLIESRSIGGLSGSPVFTNLTSFRILNGTYKNVFPNDCYALLGITWGHWDVPNDLEGKSINAGISIITPASRIVEVLNQTIIRAQEEWNELRIRLETAATLDSKK